MRWKRRPSDYHKIVPFNPMWTMSGFCYSSASLPSGANWKISCRVMHEIVKSIRLVLTCVWLSESETGANNFSHTAGMDEVWDVRTLAARRGAMHLGPRQATGAPRLRESTNYVKQIYALAFHAPSSPVFHLPSRIITKCATLLLDIGS